MTAPRGGARPDGSQGARPAGFVGRVRDGLFGLIVVGGLIAVLAVCLRQFAFDHVDEEIRVRAQAYLAEYFPGKVIELKSARLVENEGIALKGVTVSAPQEESELYIEEIFAAAKVDWQQLMTKPLVFDHLRVRGVDLLLVVDGDWRESLAAMLPQSEGDEPIPATETTDIQVELREKKSGKSVEFRLPTLVVTDNRLAPNLASELPTSTRRRQASPKPPRESEAAIESERLVPPASEIEGGLAFRGVIESKWPLTCDFTGRIDPAAMQWEIEGHVETLDVTPGLIDSLPFLPAALTAKLGASRIQGKARGDFFANSHRSGELPITFGVKGKFFDGKVDDPRLSQPLVSLGGRLEATSEGARIDGISAEMGEAKLSASMRLGGYGENAPLAVKLVAKGLRIDKRLWKLLPPEAQRAETMFSPQGVIDLDLTAKRKNGVWAPDLTLQARGLSLEYEMLRYPLTDAQGTVIYRPGELRTEKFTAKAAGQTVRILVDLQFSPGERYGVIDVASQGPIPIDERLLRALKPVQRQILRDLDARGSFMVDCNVVLDSTKTPPMKLSMDLDVQEGSIAYHKFNYPVNQIHGKIAVRDDVWELRGLEGRRDSAYVTCDGSFTPTSKGDHLLSLNLIATDVPFSDELRIALPPNIVRLWDDMQPRGTIDHLKIDIKYPIDKQKTPPDIEVIAQKWNDKQNVRGRSISLEPMLFPMQLDQVIGKVRYHNGRIWLMNVEAKQGTGRVAVTGETSPTKSGGWQATFSDLFAERITITPEFLSALPPRLRGPIENLQLSGQFLIRGKLGMAVPSGSREVTAANWDLRVDTEDGSLSAGATIDHIRGGIRLFGDLTGKKPTCFGELAVDSLHCRNSHLSNIRGPLSIDSERIMLGAWSTPSKLGARPVSLSAEFCSGRATADCGFELSKEGRFSWQARFEEVDLAELARDTAPSLKGTTGRASGQLDLKGTREGEFTWRGGGDVMVRNAKIYELPVFLAALKNLGAKAPDKSAFHTADLRFVIEGQDVSFQQLDLEGDGIEMRGKGTVSMDGEMNLQFYTQVGPNALRPQFFRPLMGAASRQLLVIEATGPVQAPDVRRIVFPGVNELLNQMFPESKQAAKPAGGPPSYAPARAMPASAGTSTGASGRNTGS